MFMAIHRSVGNDGRAVPRKKVYPEFHVNTEDRDLAAHVLSIWLVQIGVPPTERKHWLLMPCTYRRAEKRHTYDGVRWTPKS